MPNNNAIRHKYKLIGKNYTTPDLVAKVTGKAKYAEDYRADGMLFCKLLLSPMPHARVRSIDAQRGAGDARREGDPDGGRSARPADSMTDNGTVIPANKLGERGLTNEPVYQGEPILAVAAVDELTAAEAIEKINIDLRAAAVRRRSAGHACVPAGRMREWKATSGFASASAADSPGSARRLRRPTCTELKWTEADFAEAKEGQLPMGKATDEWSSAMSTRASRTPRWCWTKRSSRRIPATSPWRLAPPWRTGRTARSTFTPARRAPRRPSRRSRAGWASNPTTSSSSANTPAAASAARSPAPSR